MTDTEIEVVKCIDCDEEMERDEYGDLTGDYQWWEEGVQCWGCYEGEYPSTAYHYIPGEGVNHETGKVPMYYVYDHGFMDQYGDTYGAGLELTRGYTRTDGWRGYYTARPVGDDWYEARSGWTTGDWGDSVSNGKRNVNEWMERLITGQEEECPVEVVVIFDPTSNVFSTSVGIWVHDEDEEAFTAYVGGSTEGL